MAMAKALLYCLLSLASADAVEPAETAVAPEPPEEPPRFLQARALKLQSQGSKEAPSSRSAVATSVSSDGGAELWMSKLALNYVAQELLPQVLQNLTKVPLGSFSGSYKGVQYRLWDVDLNHVGIKTPSIEFRKDKGVQLCLSGIWANVTSDWSAEWYFLSLNGGTSVLVTDGQLCADLGLKALSGRPQVEVSDLNVNLELGPITFSGTSIHWLMNAAAFLFESYLEDLAAKTIKSNVEAAVKTSLAESLQKMNLSASVDLPDVNQSVAVDLSLQAIKTTEDYLQVNVDGLPSVGNQSCPFPRQRWQSKLPEGWKQRMVSGSLSDWGIHCGIWAVNRTGLLSYKLLPWWVPNNTLGIGLYSDFMSLLVPGLKHKHPYNKRNYPLEMTLMPLPTPSFKFESGYMYLVSPILFSFTTLLTKSGKREFCFSFIADVHAQGYLWIEQNPMRLRSNLTLLGATDVREQGSIAGPIELKYAAQLLQVLRGPGEHALNTGPVGQAIPLSSNSTFSLKNTEVNISKDGLFFFSDVAVRFGQEVHQLLSRQFSPAKGDQ